MRGDRVQQGTRLGYQAGLDGLRAFAVAAVVLYHAQLGFLRGGFLGVDVFFVVSGYLITSLLLSEWDSRKALDLGAFWRRRARRLLPALMVMLLAVVGYSVFFLPGEVSQLRGQVYAALGYVTNWYFVFSHVPYFEAVGRPPLLQHLWSLAVEEQFYLLWPPLFLLLVKRVSRPVVAVLLVVGAIASAGLMASLYVPENDTSRLYYGTDTRAAGLLLGAALAFVWQSGRLPSPLTSALRWPVADLLGFGGIAALVYLFFHLDGYQAFVYQGGFLLVAAVSTAVIAVVVQPEARLLRSVLSLGPLRWLGTRSYGIYLWHWPVFLLTRPGLDVQLDGLALLAVRLAITFAATELSYRLVETPVRAGAIGEAWRALRAGCTSACLPWRRWTVATASLVPMVAYLGFAVAAADPPQVPGFLAIGAVDTIGTRSAATSSASAPPENTTVAAPATVTSAPPPVGPGGRTVEEIRGTAYVSDDERAWYLGQSGLPVPTAVPSRPAASASRTAAPPVVASVRASGVRVTAIGDSVMLGAAPQLEAGIPAIEINAAVSRQVAAAIEVLRGIRDSGQLGDVVLLHIGYNGTFTARQIDQVMEIVDGRRVVFLTLREPRDWEAPNNRVIADAASRYANVTVVDWHNASDAHPEYFYDDGIHLRPSGAQAYAALVAAAIGR